LAAPAQPEQLEPMRVDAEAGPAPDLGDRLGDATILGIGRSPAPGTDNVMVVGPGTWNVGVLPGREIQPLDHPELGQKLERPEQRRPADPEPAVADDVLELGRREVARLLRDEVGHGSSRPRHSVAGDVERIDDRILRIHAVILSAAPMPVETRSQ